MLGIISFNDKFILLWNKINYSSNINYYIDRPNKIKQF